MMGKLQQVVALDNMGETLTTSYTEIWHLIAALREVVQERGPLLVDERDRFGLFRCQHCKAGFKTRKGWRQHEQKCEGER